jgi:hypothetical protein
MFGRPHPQPAPVRFDGDALDQPTTEGARARLAALPGERVRLHAEHQRQIAPMLQRRERLQAELARVDDELATAGVHYQDQVRALDREAERLTGLLPAVGPGADQDEDVINAKDVRRLLGRLRADHGLRLRTVGGTPVVEEAMRVYDAEMDAILEWGKTASQAVAATGRTSATPPDCASHWPRERIVELTGIHLP